MVKPPGYIYGIDLIRFLAALSVVGFHLGYLNDVADFKPIWPITWFGWIGVEVFFVISGFVIANSANGKSPMQFLKGRALRLYPAVWCCATLTLIVAGAISDQPLIELLPSYLRSLALIPKGPWIDDVYWTLAVEIGFYTLIFGLLYAGMFLLLTRVSLVLTAFTLIFMIVVVPLWPMAFNAEQYMTGYLGLSDPLKSLGTDVPTLIALIVCLIPTTIGALLAAIGIAGMDRALRANIIAKSGKAVEVAGDIDTVMLDKTGTITLGDRHAREFVPLGGTSRAELMRLATRPSNMPRTCRNVRQRGT